MRNVKAYNRVCLLCNCTDTIFHTDGSCASKTVPSQA